MKLRLPLLSALCLHACLTNAAFAAGDGAVKQPIKPNIVLIFVEDVGYGDLSFQGNRFNETPHIDRLATTGINFSQAYAAAPAGLPTRVAALTGKQSVLSRVTREEEPFFGRFRDRPGEGKPLLEPTVATFLGPEQKTFADVLGEGGYSTHWIGKWDVGGWRHSPAEYGFESHKLSSIIDRLQYRVLPFYFGRSFGPPVTESITQAALDVVNTAGDKPFLMVLSHFGAQMPLQVSAEREQYFQKKLAAGGDFGKYENVRYAAALADLDDSVGKVVQRIEQKGLAEKTLFIVMSDNGGLTAKEYFLGDYFADSPATHLEPLKGGKGSLYEGGIRIPMIMNWEGLLPLGFQYNGPVIAQDIFPTLLAAGGRKDYKDFSGVNLFDAAIGREFDRYLYWHFPHYSHEGGVPGGAVRKGRFKLVQWFEDGAVELYDLKKDPGETRNLARDMPSQLRKMASEMYRWRVWNRVPMPKPVDGASAASAYNPEVSPETSE